MQDTGAVDKIGKLHFVEVASPDRDSISGDFTSGNCFGIYVYRFTDGMYYVGKSKDVRDRHVQHKHEYAKMDPPRVIERMWWASVNGDDLQLDFAETQAIAAYEAKGCSLTNVLKTNRPCGNEMVMVDTGNSWGVPIPWERENLPKSKVAYLFDDDASKLSKFEKLTELPEFPEILDILRTYVNATIAAPSDTAGRLWVATAMPSTGKGNRLCCISVQNAETLVIYKGRHWGKEKACGYINVKKPDGGHLPRGIRHHWGFYGTLPDCYRLDFRDLKSMRDALHNEAVLDCCYRANAELMRRGVTMYGRFNNPYLVDAILDGLLEGGARSEDMIVMAVRRGGLDDLKRMTSEQIFESLLRIYADDDDSVELVRHCYEDSKSYPEGKAWSMAMDAWRGCSEWGVYGCPKYNVNLGSEPQANKL